MIDKGRIEQIESALNALKIPAQNKTLLFRDLAPALQSEVRSLQWAMGPLTSSGLEHVYQIFNRLDFARFQLKYPDIDTEGYEPSRPATSPEILSTNQKKPVTIKRLSGAATVSSNESGLDFGPYDPRKR